MTGAVLRQQQRQQQEVAPESRAPGLSLVTLRSMGVGRAEARPHTAGSFALADLVGRLVELSSHSGSAALTAAFGLVLQAQTAGEPVAWVCGSQSSFYPPDVAASGVDLSALVVVRAQSVRHGVRALDHLGRSGAFGLLVFDPGPAADLPAPVLTRMNGQATHHNLTMLLLTHKGPEQPSASSVVSVRGHVERQRVGEDRFCCAVQVLKDKRGGPGWRHEEICRGPDGLC